MLLASFEAHYNLLIKSYIDNGMSRTCIKRLTLNICMMHLYDSLFLLQQPRLGYSQLFSSCISHLEIEKGDKNHIKKIKTELKYLGVFKLLRKTTT